jgi:hypothetical protein
VLKAYSRDLPRKKQLVRSERGAEETQASKTEGRAKYKLVEQMCKTDSDIVDTERKWEDTN